MVLPSITSRTLPVCAGFAGMQAEASWDVWVGGTDVAGGAVGSAVGLGASVAVAGGTSVGSANAAVGTAGAGVFVTRTAPGVPPTAIVGIPASSGGGAKTA